MVHLITFKGENKFFAIESCYIQEIIHIPELSSPGGLPGFLKGFFNIEGTIFSALQFSELLGLKPEPPGIYSPVLVMKKPANTAFIVDSLGELVKVNESEIVKVTENVTLNHCIESCIKIKGKPIFLLHIDRLLLELEAAKIKELLRIEQMRISRLNSNATR